MENDQYIGLAILLCIIAIAAFGGFKSSALNQSGGNAQSSANTNSNPTTTNPERQKSGQRFASATRGSKLFSVLRFGFHSVCQPVDRPGQRIHRFASQLECRARRKSPAGVCKACPADKARPIPDGVQLYFQNQANGTMPIVVNPGDTVYLITVASRPSATIFA